MYTPSSYLACHTKRRTAIGCFNGARIGSTREFIVEMMIVSYISMERHCRWGRCYKKSEKIHYHTLKISLRDDPKFLCSQELPIIIVIPADWLDDREAACAVRIPTPIEQNISDWPLFWNDCVRISVWIFFRAKRYTTTYFSYMGERYNCVRKASRAGYKELTKIKRFYSFIYTPARRSKRVQGWDYLSCSCLSDDSMQGREGGTNNKRSIWIERGEDWMHVKRRVVIEFIARREVHF